MPDSPELEYLYKQFISLIDDIPNQERDVDNVGDYEDIALKSKLSQFVNNFLKDQSQSNKFVNSLTPFKNQEGAEVVSFKNFAAAVGKILMGDLDQKLECNLCLNL